MKNILGPFWEAGAAMVQDLRNYWELYMGWLPYSQQVLLALILIILGIPACLLLRSPKSRRPGKLKTGRDIRREAKWCEKNHEYVRAGELYETIEQYKQAIKMFMQGKSPERAARLYIEKFDDFDGALAALTEFSAWEQAGNLCDKAGRFREAAQFYEQANKLRTAADMYSQAQEYGKAAILYERTEFPPGSRQRLQPGREFRRRPASCSR